jgi:hypothetical protein
MCSQAIRILRFRPSGATAEMQIEVRNRSRKPSATVRMILRVRILQLKFMSATTHGWHRRLAVMNNAAFQLPEGMQDGRMQSTAQVKLIAYQGHIRSHGHIRLANARSGRRPFSLNQPEPQPNVGGHQLHHLKTSRVTSCASSFHGSKGP